MEWCCYRTDHAREILYAFETERSLTDIRGIGSSGSVAVDLSIRRVGVCNGRYVMSGSEFAMETVEIGEARRLLGLIIRLSLRSNEDRR